MARYSALTAAAQVANIDVVQTAAAIAQNAAYMSAFMDIVFSQSGPRQRIWTKEGSMTWATGITEGAAPDEVQYTPTAVATTNVLHQTDAVLTQYALQDAATSNKALDDQVVDVGAGKYADYFDSLCAALYATCSSSNPDHIIGASTAALTAPLIDAGIDLLLTQNVPGVDRLALVIRSNKISELMAIPGMRDKAIRGAAGPGGVDGPNNGIMRNRRKIVEGYAGILDVYHTPEIDVSTGTHNLLIAVGDGGGEQAAIVNPWSPMIKDTGVVGGKLNVDVWWNHERRAVEIAMSTIETVQWRDSTTASKWAVDLVTAPAS